MSNRLRGPNLAAEIASSAHSRAHTQIDEWQAHGTDE